MTAASQREHRCKDARDAIKRTQPGHGIDLRPSILRLVFVMVRSVYQTEQPSPETPAPFNAGHSAISWTDIENVFASGRPQADQRG
ncbi:hypothetical protein, partial [Bradyrhizobium lablabi]|uniref:hypothetical protein n=1 Tax=Bradyrhizobium lablabi TaxID=722472 RepID=UPI001AECA410